MKHPQALWWEADRGWTIATMEQGRRNIVWIVRRNLLWIVLTAANMLSWHRRQHPPADLAGVREPRRPKPTLPTAAIALAEPRTERRQRIRLTNLREEHR